MFDYFEVLIGFIATLITAYAGYKKYIDDKQFNHYKDNIKNLFHEKKEEVLAAIATLGVYKNKKSYKKSTTDTLLNLLYTQLDYDISNAVIGVLAQTNRKAGFEYIINKLIEINRNFFTQTYPLGHREKDLQNSYESISGAFLGKHKNVKKEDADLTEWKNAAEKKWISFKQINEYELKWHKLATGDVLAMILRRAAKAEITKKIKIEFFQNDFTFCQFNGFALYGSSIRRSAISVSALTDVSFIDFSIIEDCTFERSLFTGGVISGKKIKDTSFCGAQFYGVLFQNIEFQNTFFIGAVLRNCEFRNIKGLEGIEFYSCDISDDTKIDPLIRENILRYKNAEEAIAEIEKISMLDPVKREIISYIKTFDKNEAKETLNAG